MRPRAAATTISTISDGHDRTAALAAAASSAPANGLNSSSAALQHAAARPISPRRRGVRSSARRLDSADDSPPRRCSAVVFGHRPLPLARRASSASSRTGSASIAPIYRPSSKARCFGLGRRLRRFASSAASAIVSASSTARQLARRAGSGSWCQLCLQDAQRTCRPCGGIAPSFTTYCVPQFGQVRIIRAKALFRDGERRVNRNAPGLARRAGRRRAP